MIKANIVMGVAEVFSVIASEIKLIFDKPRDAHRVFATIPLAAIISQAHYLYQNASPLPLTKPEIMSFTLGGVLTSFLLLWCLLSGKMHRILFLRFFFMSGWAVLGHKIIIDGNQFSGTSLYALVFSWLCMTALGFFALTGKTMKDVQEMGIKLKQNEKADNLITMSDRSAG